MTFTITDLRNDPKALAAFVSSWEFDPIAAGKPFGLRREHAGKVRCERVFASERTARAALNRGNPR